MSNRKACAEFTAAEVKMLLVAMDALRAHRDANGLNGDGKAQTVQRINEKVWRLYASSHPEEGPFK